MGCVWCPIQRPSIDSMPGLACALLATTTGTHEAPPGLRKLMYIRRFSYARSTVMHDTLPAGRCDVISKCVDHHASTLE